MFRKRLPRLRTRFQSISRIVVTLGRVVLKNRMALLVYPAKSRKVLLIPMTKIDCGSCIHFQEISAATRRITGCARTFVDIASIRNG